MVDFQKKNLFEFEKHPYLDHINGSTRTLIIGTFPSHAKNAGFKFFYGGEGNMLWSLLAIAYQEQFKSIKGESAIRERKAFLDKYHIGITDMISSCYRYRESSGDENIFPVVINDILAMLEEHPSINRLIFTSRTFIVGALGRFRTYLLTKGIELDDLVRESSSLLKGTFNYGSRKIDIWVPISPSKRVQNENKYSFEEMTAMYKKAFRS